MKSERFMRVVLILLCIGLEDMLMSSFVTATEVSVEITDRGRHQIKIAIPPFVSQTESSDEISTELLPVLQNVLRLSGFFDTMDGETVHIEGLHNTDLKEGEIQFKQWFDLGARLLVKGHYELNGDMLKIEGRVYDTLGGDFILGKRYESDISHAKEVMHRFADEIVLKITGERGMSTAKIVFVSDRSGTRELYQIDFNGTNLTRLTHDNSLVMSPSVSPDGKKICYTSYKGNNPDLYILSLDNQQVEDIAMYPGLNFSADWSPDGRTLALTLSKDGNPELYLLDSISRKEIRLTKNRWNDVSPSWSPNGMELVYTADRIGAPQLYIIKRGDNNVRRLTFRGSYNVSPAWSPTGDLIAFSSSMDGNFNIYTVQTNGDNLRQLTQNAGNNEDPAWSPDGRYIAFHSTRGGTSSIYIMNADGTNQRKLTDNQGTDLSPDWIR
jgi:TolB protein